MKCFDQRSSKRFKAKGIVALTPKGVCQILNFSKGGLSFKCFQELELPSEWQVDIYDGRELSLQELKVKKVWAKKLSAPGISSDSQMEVGGIFENLSASQEAQVYSYLLELKAAEKNT